MRHAELTQEQAEMWALSEQRHAERERAELVRAWIDHHRRLERSLRAMAQEHALAARELEEART